MPDVSRSDSNRSDASRPRVSFNRDVHVKRIAGPRTAAAYSMSADGSALVPTAVRRERPKNRRQMTKEAEAVLKQVDKLDCVTAEKPHKKKDSFLSFRKNERSSSELDSSASSNDREKGNHFFSLDRKKLKKKNKKNEGLEYLGLDGGRPTLNCDLTDDRAAKKKQLSPIIESPAVERQSNLERQSNVERIARKLLEKTKDRQGPPEQTSIESPSEVILHNNNSPFSYTEPGTQPGSYGSQNNQDDVIYAQVLVSGGPEKTKRTVHARYPMATHLYGENPARRDLYRRRSVVEPRIQNDSGRATRVRLEGRSRSFDVSPPPQHGGTLRELSMRREVLLNRSRSQAKERMDSLKRLGYRNNNETARYIGNDIDVNDRFAGSLRRLPKDVEPRVTARVKRESSRVKPSEGGKWTKEEESWRKNEKVHTKQESGGLLHRLSRLGKSKSVIEDKPRQNKVDKVKMLFRKKKDSKGSGSEDDTLTSRYTEYRGSDLELSDNQTRNNLHSDSETDNIVRKRLPTPSSSRNSYDYMGTMTRMKNNNNRESNWLKSLERLRKKAPRNRKGDENMSELSTSSKPSNLRFFGDTDQESVTTERPVNLRNLKLQYGLDRGSHIESEDEAQLPSRSESRLTDSTIKESTLRYKTRYDLDRPDYGLKQMNHGLNMNSNKYDYHSSNLSDTSTLKNCNYDFNINGMKYGPNISRSMSSVATSSRYDGRDGFRNQRTPSITVTSPSDSLSRRVKSQGNLYRGRGMYDSSAESTTEGDSGHSTKSMIYLHAATVGDIPGPKNLYKSDKSQSREELSSVADSLALDRTKRTLSRSISVLAPWRPRHFKQDSSLHYDSGNGSEFSRGKPPTGPKRSTSRERKPSELRFNTLDKENRRQTDLLR